MLTVLRKPLRLCAHTAITYRTSHLYQLNKTKSGLQLPVWKGSCEDRLFLFLGSLLTNGTHGLLREFT